MNQKSGGSVALAALHDEALIYVRRAPANGQLHYAKKKIGEPWGPDKPLGQHFSATGASLGVLNNQLFCVHRGAGAFNEDTKLYWTTYDYRNDIWSKDTPIDNAYSLETPALSDFNEIDGKQYMYCVHSAGAPADGRLWCTKYNEGKWSQDATISETGHNSSCIALAFHRDKYPPREKLYCVHNVGGPTGRLTLNLSFHNGFNWIDAGPIPNRFTATICLSWHGEKLYCIRSGRPSSGADGHFFWLMIHDGERWSVDEKLPFSPGKAGGFVTNPGIAWLRGVMHFIYPHTDDLSKDKDLYQAAYTPD
jgi:hypothetical protein